MNNNTIKKIPELQIFTTLIVLSVILTGCILHAQTSSGQPNALINNIKPGTQFPVGQPIMVEVIATDPAGFGLSAVELKADDKVVDSYQVPDKAKRVDIKLKFTPTKTGTSTLIAYAYRDNGMSGSSARLSIEIIDAK